VVLVLFIRLQKRLKPYKLEENNWIELVALVAGTTTMYAGFIFSTEGGAIYGFYQLTAIMVFCINLYFIVNWVFLLLCSFNWKNENYVRFLKIYGLLICKKNAPVRLLTTEIPKVPDDDLTSEVVEKKEIKIPKKRHFNSILFLSDLI